MFSTDPSELQQIAELWANRTIYSSPTLIGQWHTDLALQEEKNYIHNYKKKNGLLLIQKLKKMIDNLLHPATLAMKCYPNVLIGENYLIKSSFRDLYLSALMTEKEIDQTQNLEHGCCMSAAPGKEPCARNTFKFVGCESNKYRELKYGEDVYIQIVYKDNPECPCPLYVQCENSTLNIFWMHLKLRLCQNPDFYSRFRILHWNPPLRFETIGVRFKPNIPVIIQHCASGRNLAVELNALIPTFFGQEVQVSCETYRDTNKRETAENYWTLVNGS